MKQLSTVLLFVVYSAVVFAVGLVVGWGGSSVIDGISADTPSSLRTDFAPFWQVWNIVNNDYFEQPLNTEILVEGAIEGMLATLDDRNTRYLSPEEQEREEADMEGEFEGIGARIDYRDDVGVIIVSPIVGSPAEAAGLQPEDVILKADGEPLETVDEAIELIRGEANTDVLLTIQRGDETFDIIVTRGIILVPDVVARMLDDENLAYLQLTQFGNNSADKFKEELENLLNQNPDGLIIDVRNNPGGLLSAVIEIADELLPEGIVLQEQFGNGNEQIYRSDSGDIGESIPLVILINEGSASASEVLAGAIEARDRGELVGELSFGKGTVQSVRTLTNGGGLRVTIAHWRMPDGEWIHETGLEPDIVIPQEPSTEGDPQLDAAIDLLQEQIAER